MKKEELSINLSQFEVFQSQRITEQRALVPEHFALEFFGNAKACQSTTHCFRTCCSALERVFL